MVNWWFGARRSGFLTSLKMKGIVSWIRRCEMNPPLRILKGFRILGGTKSIETRLQQETTHRDKKTQGTKHPEPGAATFMKLSLDQIRNRWVLEQLSEETSWQRAEDQAKKNPLVLDPRNPKTRATTAASRIQCIPMASNWIPEMMKFPWIPNGIRLVY